MKPLTLLLLAAALPASAQPVGMFEAATDVGPVRHAGTAQYDADSQTYRIAGSGTNMWGAQDEFHFVWTRLTGDFVLRARMAFTGEGVDPHRKIGWMIRRELSGASAYVDAALHGDGLTSLQYRREQGAETEEVQSEVSAPDVVQLSRKGDSFVMSVARFGDEFTHTPLAGVDLGDAVYVGLFACAHNADVVEEGVFRNVRIVRPAADDFRPYQDYIGANLEILDVETGHRTVVDETAEAMQAPNWTPDGRTLIVNENGLLYRFDLANRTRQQIDTGFATRNNNDHVLSFDGTVLGISHHAEDADGASIVYTLPVEGGTPQRVTPLGPSYLHGFSPDGEWMTYTGGRNDNYDIYKIRVTGGDEVRLTTEEGLDDGSEYSPDGEYIYYNSTRSGLMQIWRMRPDGTEHTQITQDGLNNWFPHISPDGKWIAFLSYLPDVNPSDHPWYKHVYLRLLPVDGSADARVVAYVYGGQGTINVPSWAPDSRRLAFVSNTLR